MTRTAKAILRVIAVFLAFILGFLSCVGAIAGVGYYVYSALSLDTLKGFGVDVETEGVFDPDAEVPVSSLTIQKLVEEMQYIMSIGDEADLDMLIERYGLKLPEEAEGLIPSEVREVPLSVLFSPNGIEVILESVEVDSLLELVPEGIITEQTKAALSGKTLADVASLNLGYLLSGVKLGYLTGVSYVMGDSGEYEVVYANPEQPTTFELLAPLDLGVVLDAITGASGEDIFSVVTDCVGDVMLETFAESIVGDLSALPIPGLFGDLTLSDLLVYDDATDTYYIDVMALINGRQLGELLGYYYDTAEEKWYVTEGGEPVDTMLAAVCGINCSDLLDPGADRTQIDVLLEAAGTLELGSLMGYEFGDTDNDGDEEWYQGTEGNYTYPAGAEKALLDIKISDLLGEDPLDAAFADLYVGDLLGYYHNPDDNKWYVTEGGDEVEVLYAKLADYSVSDLMSGNLDLETSFADVYVGELLGYYHNPDDNKWYVTEGGDEVEVLYAKLADYSVSDLMSGNLDLETSFADVYVGDLLGYYHDTVTGKWYVTEGGDEVEVLYAKLADYSVADLMNGELDLETSFADVYVGELLGYYHNPDDNKWYVTEGGDEVEVLYAKLADYSVADLMNGELDLETSFADVYVGELLGYEFGDIDNDGVDEWYEKKGEDKVAVSTLQAKIAGYSITDLMDGKLSADALLDGMILADVLELKPLEDLDVYLEGNIVNLENDIIVWVDAEGNTVNSMLNALAHLGVDDIQNNINGLKLGDIASLVEYEGKWYTWEYITSDGRIVLVPDSSLATDLAGITFAQFADGSFEAEIRKIKIGRFIGYTLGADGEWYNNGSLVDCGILGVFVDLTLSDLGSRDTVQAAIHDIHIYEVLGYTRVEADGEIKYYNGDPENPDNLVTGVLNAIAGVVVGELNQEIVSMKIGDLAGYTKVVTTGLNGEEIVKWYNGEAKPENLATGILGALADISINDVSDEGALSAKIKTLKVAEVLGYTEDNGKWYNGTISEANRVTGIMGEIAGLTIESLNTEINGIKIGKLAGLTEDGGKWYNGEVKPENLATGVLGALADLTINEVTNEGALSAKIKTLKVAEVLGYTEDNGKWYNGTISEANRVTGIMGELAGLTIDSLSTEIDKITIGKLAGYTKVVTNGENGAEITEWYDGEVKPENLVTGIMGALADLTINDIYNEGKLSEKIQTLTVADVLGYKMEVTEGENGEDIIKYYIVKTENGEETKTQVTGVMAVIAGSQVGNIQGALDNTEMGLILGYTKDEYGVWHDEDGEVDGLMNAIANTTFENLDKLYSTLTVSDIISDEHLSSGFLSLIDPNTSLSNIGGAIDNAFKTKSIGEMINKGIIQLDEATCTKLDFAIGTDWRNQPLPTAIQYILDKLLNAGG